MRRSVLIMAAMLALLLPGCARAVSGQAVAPPQPGVTLTEDGFGILAGDPDAPVQLELYTEPQCPHCAELQADHGDELRHYLRNGQLGLTYRPLAFFDTVSDGPSSRMANALFLAADTSPTAARFQDFARDLWTRIRFTDVDQVSAQLVILAEANGLSEIGFDIADNRSAVDTEQMDVNNALGLAGVHSSGTPTVYDLGQDTLIDISDPDWLDRLMRAA